MRFEAVRILLLAGALLAAGCHLGASPGRVVVLGLDGIDPEVVDLLLSEGQLPNFARMRQGGAYGRLRSQKPLLSPVVWTTIATGKSPLAHGISHFVAVNPQILLHLGQVSFIDSAGLGMLVRYLTRTLNASGALRICAVSPAIDRVLAVSRLKAVLQPFEQCEQAFQVIGDRVGHVPSAANHAAC